MVLLESLSRSDTEDGFQGAHGEGMVEVLVLIEPLVGKVALAGVHEGRVVRSEVLDTTLNGNEGVSSIVNCIVEELETKWLPSLFDLWIGIVGDVQVSIDAGKNAVGELIESVTEGSVENNLGVRVPGEVILETFGRGFAI